MSSSGAEEFAARTDVSRETLAALETYSELLKEWNKTINLVSPKTLEALWTRHFLDSAQLFDVVRSTGVWADLGSGGGFPGLVIAIMKREAQVGEVILVEADQRKATFLRTVIRTLHLPARVVVDRIEHAKPLHADVVSARALAPLSTLLGFAERHLNPSGTAVFPKGEKAEEEIAEALENWVFDCEKLPSQTDANSAILRIGDIKRV